MAVCTFHPSQASPRSAVRDRPSAGGDDGNHLPGSVGGAAELALSASGDARRLARVLARNALPMLLVDGERRYVEANSAARLAFRMSLQELRGYTIDDLTPPAMLAILERNWTQLLESACVAGQWQMAGTDGSRLDLVYCALANVLPGSHVIVFAPAGWPEDEFATGALDAGSPAAALTRRELEVLELAAEGAGTPELAAALEVSPDTVRTHLKNIYMKLGVHNRTGAVTKGMRLGLIDC
jgi:DNA-binding CsgD family transcriptional regulator